MGGLTAAEIAKNLRNVGVENGDICIFHSSYKSLGPVDGGAQTVINGFEAAIGKDGTLVVPTLCQVDFENSYKTWHMDKPSDVGYLTEFFRKLMYVYRSDHPTHSVAARGRLAYELTFEHARRGPHYCPFGDYAFCDSSPWYKMYQHNAKQVFLGVSMKSNTMKHLLEGWLVEELLNSIEDVQKRHEQKAKLHVFGGEGIYVMYNGEKMQAELSMLGLVREGECGSAHVLCVNAKEASDAAMNIMRTRPESVFRADGDGLKWINECRRAAKG